MIAVSVLSAWGTFASCTSEVSPDTQIIQEATDLQKRTIPPGSRLLAQHPIALHESVARADWEFLSNYSTDGYNRWVDGKLREDFQSHQAFSSNQRYSKAAHGDVETLSIETAESPGALRVVVKLEIYPD